MTLEEFQQLVNKHRPTGYALGEFETGTPDYRFGIKDKKIAMIYKVQANSVVFTFRVGLTTLLIDKFNKLGAHAVDHDSLDNMFLVTIDNDAFSDEMISLIEKSIVKALNKFYQ